MKLTDTKNVMVYIEIKEGKPIGVSLEALAKAREIADDKKEEVVAVVVGKIDKDVEKLIVDAGADKVVVVENEKLWYEKIAAILKEVVKKYKPSMVIAGASLEGKDITGVVAKEFETECVTDVLNIVKDGENYILTTPVYGGTVLNDVIVKSVPLVMTTRPGSFAKNIVDGRKGEVIKEDIVVGEDILFTKLVDIIKDVTEAVNLEDAEVIVSGGRGMGTKENFKLVEELAKVCGGVVGATRPAIEDEWIARSHQVGQSGKIVAPKLYIACGISGATQHVSGMIGSDYIVAINKDEDAPIFDIADVGIVGDVTKVIPLLIEEIKKIKA